MSVHGGKTRGQKRPLASNDNQPDGDIRTMIRRLVQPCIVSPHEDTQYELDTQDMRIVTMQPHPSTLLPDTAGANPYSRPGNMDWGTTSKDVDMEQQLPTHEVGGNVGDS
jgi:hypothetical protein